MIRICLSGLVVIALLGLSPAQSTVYVPDSSSSTGAACNAIPFSPSFFTSGGGATYVGRIPASFLSQNDRRLLEVSFAPCGTGTWTSTTVKFAVGHLPTPAPNPLAFPTAAGLGSFLDLTWIYDAAVQGPFTWSPTLNTWSPLGFNATGGTGFCWNGVNDIGFYATYQTAGTTVAGFTGNFYRSGTEPYRFYASSFGAPASTGSGAAGLKMKLDFIPCGATLYQVNSPGAGLLINGIQGVPTAPTIVTVPVNSVVTVSFLSTNVGLPWEVALAFSPLVPLGGGGLATGSGQILNVDLTSPTLLFLNGGLYPSFSTPFPGNLTAPLAVGATPLTLSAQQLNVEPNHPDGFRLSQGVQLVVQ